MADAYDDARALLDERPGLADGLEAAVAADVDGPWGFEDVPVDSGAFGELVARDFVEDVGDGYRLTDREAVAAAVRGEPRPGEGAGASNIISSLPRADVPDRRELGVLVAGLLAVALARTYIYSDVFRRGDVVLLANDPYMYAYLLERYGALAGETSVSHGEPLLLALLHPVADAVGVGPTLAWYPVAAALVTAVAVYALARRFAGRLAAVAALGFLAVLPAHAIRTALGFGDHHALDLVWLALVMVALVGTLDAVRRRWPWAAALAVGVAAQALAWDSGPLLLAPIVAVVGVGSVVAVADDRCPLRRYGPVAAAAVAGAAAVVTVHVALGWQPVALVGGTVAVAGAAAGAVAVAALARRRGLGPRQLVVVYAVGAVVGPVVLALVAPDLTGAMLDQAAKLVADRPAISSTGLFGLSPTAYAMPFVLFGFTLFVGIAGLPVAVRRAREEPVALVLAVFGLWLLGAATLQARLGTALSLPIAALAGATFVGFCRWVDVVADDGGVRSRQWLAAAFVVLVSLSAIQTPIKMDQMTHDGDLHDAARWIEGDAEDRELDYPENYVFSDWGVNRMLNYFVNGESKSYFVAQREFRSRMRSTDPGAMYDELGRLAGTGYLVLRDEDVPPGANASTVARTLHDRWGGAAERGRADGAAGTGRFQLAWRRDGVQVFRVVPGVRLVRNASAPAIAVVDVTVNGTTRTYRRRVPAHGSVRLAYPGTYRVGDGTVAVSSGAVRRGERVGER